MRARILATLVTVSAAFSSLLAASTGRAEVIERVVAVVNDDAIFLSEVRQKAAPFVSRAMAAPTEAQRLAAIEQIYCQVLDHLADQRLVEQAAEEGDITVTDADVDRAIQTVREQAGLGVAAFWAAVAEQGFGTQEEYRADIRAQLLHFRVLNERMGSRINITEEDVRRRYDELMAQARRRARFDAAQIMVPLAPTANATQVARARREAEGIRSEIEDEADFEEAFETYDGRELRGLEQGDLDPDLEEALLALEPGQVSGVVRGSRGFFVFMLRSRQLASEEIASYDTIRMDIYNEMRQAAMQHQEETMIEELRRDAAIERRMDCPSAAGH
jgi:peptidyl-prolyl cis-trans isomerase SurA